MTQIPFSILLKLKEIEKNKKMIEKGYWQNYLETIKIGESIDCNYEERVFFDFDISSELNTIAKGNSNNAKLLLISAIREVLANNQINLFLAFELSNQIIPISIDKIGDVKMGAKKLLEESRQHHKELSIPFSIDGHGVLVTDELSNFTGNQLIEFEFDKELNKIKISCLSSFFDFSFLLLGLAVDNYKEVQNSELNHEKLISSFDKIKNDSYEYLNKRKELIQSNWKTIFTNDIIWEKGYFANGGDSIQAIRFLSKLKEAGANVQLASLLNTETLEQWKFSINDSKSISSVSDGINDSGKYQLSTMQKRIWSHSLSNKNNGAYHEQLLFELKNHPGIEVIRNCMEAIWLSYNQLRVAINDEGGDYYQIVENKSLEFYDNTFSSVNEALDKDKLEGFLNSLLKITYFTVGEKNYLLWSHHHVILDGWSVGILIQEFVQRINLNNFAVDVKGNKQFELVKYENGLLIDNESLISSSTKPIRLIGDKLEKNPSFETVSFNMDAIIQEHSFCSDLQITRQLLMCGVLGLSLKSKVEIDDFFINSISSGRSHLDGDADNAVGLFIRNIEVSFSLSDDESTKTYFINLKKRFNEIVLNDLKDSLTVNELSEVSDFLFIYENYPFEQIESDLFSAELIHAEEITGYPITFCLFPLEKGYTIRIVYDSSKYSIEFIQNLFKNFELNYKNIFDNQEDVSEANDSVFNGINSLILDEIGYEEIQKAKDSGLSLYGNKNALFSEIFPSENIQDSDSPKLISTLDYLITLLCKKSDCYWENKFQLNKGDLIEYSSQNTEYEDLDIIKNFTRFLNKNIWNTNFHIGISTKQIILPLNIDVEYDDTKLLEDINNQIINFHNHLESLKLIYQDINHTESNFLIQLDNSAINKDAFDLVFKKTDINNWTLFSRSNIDSIFLDKLILAVFSNEKKSEIEVNYNLSYSENHPINAVNNLSVNMLDLIQHNSTNYPENIAVEFDNRTISYKELDVLSSKFAQKLTSDLKIDKSNFIGIKLPRSIEQVVAIVAIIKLGKGFVPIETDWPENRIQKIIVNAEIDYVIDEINLSDLSDIELDATFVENTSHIDSPAYCLFTSGSTGEPKGCVINQSAILNYLEHCSENYFNSPNCKRIHVFSPLTFDFTLTSFLGGLLYGKTLVLHKEENKYETIHEALLDDFASFIKLTPSHINLIDKEILKQASSKTIVVGGEALNDSQIKKVLETGVHRLINEYGPTEATVGCIVANLSYTDLPLIGTPIKGMGVAILDEKLNHVPIGLEGELYLYGIGLAKGYINDLAKTENSFIQIDVQNAYRCYKTGDMGKMQKDGSILFTGRKDAQIKYNGYRIEVGEIESAIYSEYGLDSCVAIVNFENSSQLICFVEGELSNFKIIQHLEGKLPKYMLPNQIVGIKKIPLTKNGKKNTDLIVKDFLSNRSINQNTFSETQNIDLLIDLWLSANQESKLIFNSLYFKNYKFDDILKHLIYLKEINEDIIKNKICSIFSKNTNAFKIFENTLISNQLLISQDLDIKYINEIDFIVDEYGNQFINSSVDALIKELSGANLILPYDEKSVLVSILNHLIIKNNNENIFETISIIEFSQLKDCIKDQIVILKELSEFLNYPVLVRKNRTNEFLILFTPRDCKIFNKNQKVDENELNRIVLNEIPSEFGFKYKKNQFLLTDFRLFERFSNCFNPLIIENKLIVHFDTIDKVYYYDLDGRFILFIAAVEANIIERIWDYLKEFTPIWAHPDEIIVTDDFSLQVVSFQSFSVNDKDSDFDKFIEKYLPEFSFLKGEFGFVEQGGDSIVALRIIGKLRRKGFLVELSDLLMAKTLDNWVDKLSYNVNQEFITNINLDVKLTPIQEWFLNEYTGNKNHYNQSILLELFIPIESNQLIEVLNQVFSQNEFLSKVFRNGNWEIGKTPVIEHITIKDEVEITSNCDRLQKIFNLLEGPVATSVLFEKENKRWLFFSMHHLYCDGYSWRLILDAIQYALSGTSSALEGEEVLGMVRSANKNIYKELAHAELNEFGEIHNPFQLSKIESYKDSKYTEWEWSEEQTNFFRKGFFTGYSINEKILFYVLNCWMKEYNLPITAFFETHGRSYDSIIGLSDSLGWYTQFYPINLKESVYFKSDLELLEEISKSFSELLQNGLGYMSNPNWKRPPYPMLINFLGDFDEQWNSMAMSSPISMGELVDSSNDVLAFVELNAMIINGKMKWMLRVNTEWFKTSFAHSLESKISSYMTGIPEEDTKKDIDDDDLDAINDLLNLIG